MRRLMFRWQDCRLMDGEPGAGGGGDPKPFLGDPKPGDPPPAGGDPKPDDPPPPQPKTEEDYVKALVKDESLLGSEKEVTLDGELLKAVVPVLQKHNIAPEAANALANALAKAQVDQAKAAMKARLDYFQKMKEEATRIYQPRDFERINAGIDKYFKPGGVMNNVIRNSELGADPEFLALMHELGEAALEDKGGGGGSGGGSGGVNDPSGIAGMSKLW